MDVKELIKKVYYDPKQGLTSKKKLYEKLKEQGVSYKDVKEFIDSQKMGQEYERDVNKKEEFPINAPENSYQGDITFFDKYKKVNKGFVGILTFIEITTKKAYAYAVKSKKEKDIKEAIEKFLIESKAYLIETDDGKEFLNKSVKELFKSKKVKHITSNPYKHNFLAVINSFHRTIRRKIKKLFTMNKNKNWIDYIDDLILNYNNEYHEAIKKAPNKMTRNDARLERIKKALKTSALMHKFNFKIGDTVRIKKIKDYFTKEKKAYSGTTYKIIDKKGLSYILEGLEGTFLPYELRRVKQAEEPPEPAEKIKTVKNISTKQYTKEKKAEQIKKQLGEVLTTKRIRKPKKDDIYEYY